MCMVLFSLVYQMMLPMVESMAAVMMKEVGIDYGRSRSGDRLKIRLRCLWLNF
ncbi:MAG: hypothetical protein ACQEWE_13300 [Bacillota bacterium]